MNLSDLFGGGGGADSPCLVAAFTADATDQPIAGGASAVLVGASVSYRGTSDAYLDAFNGTNRVLSVYIAGSWYSDRSFPPGGILCSSGIKITTNGVPQAPAYVYYRLT